MDIAKIFNKANNVEGVFLDATFFEGEFSDKVFTAIKQNTILPRNYTLLDSKHLRYTSDFKSKLINYSSQRATIVEGKASTSIVTAIKANKTAIIRIGFNKLDTPDSSSAVDIFKQAYEAARINTLLLIDDISPIGIELLKIFCINNLLKYKVGKTKDYFYIIKGEVVKLKPKPVEKKVNTPLIPTSVKKSKTIHSTQVRSRTKDLS
jgi:hypothetical protein|tara:strand:- start:3765 stop:4385 length:621 start_codon:yes stop_codon:yes gene_type:complete